MPETLPGVPYGRLDRILHRLAFAVLDAQKGVGRVENRIYARQLADDAARRPVFVTSLPRAGTTVMLEVLAGLPDFAAATYRHMPFTLAPLIWQRFSKHFGRPGQRSERAHGDGIAVGLDSPEAFEEMIWMAFWPEHYRADAILPWSAEAETEDFAAFFRRHMAKIVMLEGPPARRYLSKNNANIARLGLIERLFPDATVIVQVRDPFAHVASLMRQHARFAALHARDPFARTYMEGLGHFEFGAALRPFVFVEPTPDPRAAAGPDFWLAYWADAYDWVLATAGERVVFVDHDRLSASPERHLPLLAAALDVDPAALAAAAARFRPATPVAPPQGAAPALVERAATVHAELRRRCLVPAEAAERRRRA